MRDMFHRVQGGASWRLGGSCGWPAQNVVTKAVNADRAMGMGWVVLQFWWKSQESARGEEIHGRICEGGRRFEVFDYS